MCRDLSHMLGKVSFLRMEGEGQTRTNGRQSVFCCVGALSITNSLHLVDADQLGWWLAERQLKNGGLNGRPEKLEDVSHEMIKYCRHVFGSVLTHGSRFAILGGFYRRWRCWTGFIG